MMVAARVPLERLPDAFETMGQGRGGRILVEF